MTRIVWVTLIVSLCVSAAWAAPVPEGPQPTHGGVMMNIKLMVDPDAAEAPSAGEMEIGGKKYVFDKASGELYIYDTDCNLEVTGSVTSSMGATPEALTIVRELSLYNLQGQQIDWDGNPTDVPYTVVFRYVDTTESRIDVWHGSDVTTIYDSPVWYHLPIQTVWGTPDVWAGAAIMGPCVTGQGGGGQAREGRTLASVEQGTGNGDLRAILIWPVVIAGVELGAAVGAGAYAGAAVAIAVPVAGAYESVVKPFRCDSCWRRIWNGCEPDGWFCRIIQGGHRFEAGLRGGWPHPAPA